jgi:hypothetical protein
MMGASFDPWRGGPIENLRTVDPRLVQSGISSPGR